MHCPAEETIIDFVEGRLPPHDINLLEAHVDTCFQCSELVAAALQALVHSADSVPAIEDPQRKSGYAPAGYEVLEPLGDGGMGIVYRAIHLATGELRALKTIPVRSRDALASIRREIAALSRLTHPGIIEIRDHGVLEGRPWYAMELITGTTLDQLIDQCRRRDEDTSAGMPPRLLRAMIGLCSALAFLHASGIVHGDITTKNVVVRPDGTSVLVDFGLAFRNGTPGRDMLEVLALGAGTVAFMAPEQIRGEATDPRTDLYALGSILYRCVTGILPFRGATRLDVLNAHLSEAPKRPSELASSVPPALDELILRLLEKQPRNRLGYADDVASVLCRLDSQPRVDLYQRPYLYRSEFVGRESGMTRIGEAIRALAEHRRGGRLYVSGESGAGKTRLALEAVRRASRQGLNVVVGACHSLDLLATTRGTGNHVPLQPFLPFLTAVADKCRAGGAGETARLLGNRGSVLAAYEPALALVPGADLAPELPGLEPAAARARALSAVVSTLLALAEEGPLLLVLDDLQWADELSLGVLQHLAAIDLRDHGLLIVGTYRIDQIGDKEFEQLCPAPETRIELGRLGQTDVAAMVGGMLALREPPTSIVQLLEHHSGGNPFFVVEYLRAAIEAKLLSRDSNGMWWLDPAQNDQDLREDRLPLPTTLADLIERRLAEAGTEAEPLVHAAAVLGRSFDPELLLAVVDATDSSASNAIADLRRRQIVEDAESGQLRFSHAKVREAAYARIPATERRDLHRRTAELIETRRAGDVEVAAELAHHYVRAESREKAFRYLNVAADHARTAYANQQAIAHYQQALEQGAHVATTRLGPTSEHLGEVLALVGRKAEARTAFESALAELAPSERVERARLLWKIAKTWETEHEHARALSGYDAAEAALGESATGADGLEDDAWHQWVRLQVDRVWVHYWLSDVDAMTGRLERARSTIERRGSPAERARFLQALIHAHMRADRWQIGERNVSLAHASLAAAVEAADPGGLAYARFVLAFQLIFSGQLSEAEREMQTALESAERIGDAALVARCLTYKAALHRLQRDVAGTRAVAKRALAAARELGMHDYLGVAHANLGWCDWRERALENAAKETDSALSYWGQLRPKYPYPMQWMARLHELAMALDANDSARARTSALVLLQPEQHALPESILEPLRVALTHLERSHVEPAKRNFQLAIDGAKTTGYC